MEKFKGRLRTDGNRSCPIKGKAGFTARWTYQAVGKPEFSEPTLIYRIGVDIGQKLPRG